MRGYMGLAFPVRLNNRGGLQLSTTSPSNTSHIEESIHQILGTEVYERVMETYFGSKVSSSLFEDNDLSVHSLLRFEIINALKKLEPRVRVEPEGIEFVHEDNLLYVTVNYVVLSYGTVGTTTVAIGGE